MLDGGAVAATDCLMKRNPVKGYCSDTQAEMVDCGGELVFTDAPQRLLFFGNLLNACPDASHRHEWRRRYQIMNGICDGLYYLHIVHFDLKPTNILLENCGFWSLEEILNIENKRLELEQVLGVISTPVFLASVDPASPPLALNPTPDPRAQNQGTEQHEHSLMAADLSSIHRLAAGLEMDLEVAGLHQGDNTSAVSQPGMNTTQLQADRLDLAFTPGQFLEGINLSYISGQVLEGIIEGIPYEFVADAVTYRGETSRTADMGDAQPPFTTSYVGMMQQDMGTAGTMLGPLPPSLDFQARVNMGAMQYQAVQGNTSLFQSVLQELQNACANVNMVAHQLNQILMQGQTGNLPQFMTQVHPGQPGMAPDATSPNITRSRPPGMTRRGAVYGTGVQRSTTFKRAGKRQTYSGRQKSGVRKFTEWLSKRAPDSQLSDIWIQFDEPPRIAIDGFYLKEFLTKKQDASRDMAVSMIRMMRKHEAMKSNNPEDDCHFVDHNWAERVLQDGASTDECFKLFTQPELLTPLQMCKRVVAIVDLEGKWASLSINFPNGITNLIHPALAAQPEEEVLAAYRPMCEKLTMAAAGHMMPYIASAKPLT